MLFSPFKHYLDLHITDTALKVSRSLYRFTTNISHGAEKTISQAVGYGHLLCYFIFFHLFHICWFLELFPKAVGYGHLFAILLQLLCNHCPSTGCTFGRLVLEAMVLMPRVEKAVLHPVPKAVQLDQVIFQREIFVTRKSISCFNL